MHHYIHLPSTKVADVFNNMKEYKTSKRFISFHMPLAIMVLSLILCILDGEIDIISLVLLFIIFTSLFYVTIVDKNYHIFVNSIIYIAHFLHTKSRLKVGFFYLCKSLYDKIYERNFQ